ncbi:DNA-binding PadR family transcriptional regulator [Microbacterium endophyticum]|uniref:DNA-binding PadR family transcriptional regulator n=1 Tax=Microbacterium endophyticum TaxID=1526412 RepID=A0A7W4YLL8_9MICO|nr:PadR family transcriptional regulator [Microbacterium endophyticum]MBB2975308.1 DNA-binding PadR family transcriptional regulator [Microbacterium endophyticum]NIK35673.1 DNA-binding PadR family transcriptional regulator [Microbacterium endophyticum]
MFETVTTEEGRAMAISADAIRGYIDVLVLSLLRANPSYAYELAQRITAISGDAYAIKQTTLYSAVKRLESSGLVSSSAGVSPSGKPRTYYSITDAGLIHFDVKVEEWRNTKSVVDRFINGTIEGGTP